MTPKPKNGHVLIAACKEPANMVREGGIQVHSFGFKGQFVGVVKAVDEDGPADRAHICNVGDIVYCRDPDLTGAVKVDGGETQYLIRECLIYLVVSDASVEETKRFLPTKEEFDAEVASMNAKPLLVPKKNLQLVN